MAVKWVAGENNNLRVLKPGRWREDEEEGNMKQISFLSEAPVPTLSQLAVIKMASSKSHG